MIPTANENEIRVLNKIFDENREIHKRKIQEAENQRIDNWLKKIDNSYDFRKDLKTLYMACNESNRVIKIILHYIIKKWHRDEN